MTEFTSADPDKLDAITIACSVRELISGLHQSLIVPQAMDNYTKIYCTTPADHCPRQLRLMSYIRIGKTETPNRIRNLTTERERLQRGKLLKEES
jgi:hypothetical protein